MISFGLRHGRAREEASEGLVLVQNGKGVSIR
jgi:hypothetical protein